MPISNDNSFKTRTHEPQFCVELERNCIELIQTRFFSHSNTIDSLIELITYFLFSNSKRQIYLQFCVELKHLKHYFISTFKVSNTNSCRTRTPRTILFENLERNFTSNSKRPIGTELGTSVFTRSNTFIVIELENRLNLLTSIANFYHMTFNCLLIYILTSVIIFTQQLRSIGQYRVQYLVSRSRWDYLYQQTC